jgi:hypothetical protein
MCRCSMCSSLGSPGVAVTAHCDIGTVDMMTFPGAEMSTQSP